MAYQNHPDWHAIPATEAITYLSAEATGLTEDEASSRIAIYGANAMPEPKREHPLKRFLNQFHNVLIYFLIFSAIIAWALGHPVDSSVILVVVIVNATVGFIQEGKAEQALDAIRNLVAPRASVLRNGTRRTIDAHAIVPGDIVLLEPGDQVPADMRLLTSSRLVIDESVLTGESVASAKMVSQSAPEAPLGDRIGMAFSGTMVATGQATGLVVATGSSAEIGRIGTLLSGVGRVSTPLLSTINRFGTQFTILVAVISGLLYIYSTFVLSQPWDESLLVIVALAVGAIPEGLPAVITITLAIGVRRMAERQGIIRHLPAVETLGATGVICSDKTGTLTRNEMTVVRLYTPSGEIEVEGSGYVPEGRFLKASKETEPFEALPLIEAGLACNDARLHQKSGVWTVEGDPMEGALLALAAKAGVTSGLPRSAEIPFDAAYRFMAVQAGDTIFVKGAPENVLAMCDLSPEIQKLWHSTIATAAGRGERVLGFARRIGGPLDIKSMDGFTFLGLGSFIDPPRPEALAAVAECRSAGISVKMITGDHALTAQAIAKQLKLSDAPEVLTGKDLDSISDDALPDAAQRVTVFARTSPEHKLRIVQALQRTGQIVAMTGDGVNDAPALKRADVGIAMGIKGTEAAKHAAKMVLSDDNFATIVKAVKEGRTVYDNIRKVIAWTMPTNGGEALVVIAAILLGATLPMTPVQILWINLILSATLGLVLAFEPSEPGTMSRPPRNAGEALLSPLMVWRVVFVSALIALGSYGIFEYAQAKGHDLATSRTMVVNGLIVMEIFYLFNVRYMHVGSISLRGILGTPVVLGAVAIVILAQLAFTYLPPMHHLFGSQPIGVSDGILIMMTGVALLCICETEKFVIRKWQRRQLSRT